MPPSASAAAAGRNCIGPSRQFTYLCTVLSGARARSGKQADVRAAIAELPQQAEAEFLGQPQGGQVFGLDDADRAIMRQVTVTPLQRRTDRLRRVALAMRIRRERPADLGDASDRGIEVALEIRKSKLTDETACGALLDRPIAESHQRPVPMIAQQAHPGLLFGGCTPADELVNNRLRPHRRPAGKVLERVTAKSQAFSLDDGYIVRHDTHRRAIDANRARGASPRSGKIPR